MRAAALTCLAVLLAGLCATAAVARQAGRHDLRVGTVTLRRCPHGQPGYCGAIRRPLARGLAGGPTIPIAMEWIPARHDRSRATTIVAVEGGPGYPSSGSEEEYLGTFGSTLSDHNLLMVDNRGTGGSALIRCPSLQRLSLRARASGPAFDRRVGRCAALLDRRYRTRADRPIHAADLFATGYAVEDLHAVLRRLGTGRVELYGDSYGSWFAQAYMARYPADLSAVVLDSTYEIDGLDPYYASSGLSARAAMRRVCIRSLACTRAAGGGDPVGRLASLLTRLRRHPLRGSVLGIDGRRTAVLTPRGLVDIVQDAGSDPYPWRELDASVRAALAGDTTPLLRLASDEDDNGEGPDAGYFSDGDYMAVSCTDYPQLFSMTASPAQRVAQLRAHLRAAPDGAFAPFTAAEWLSMSAYSETYDACVDWPAPVHRAPISDPFGARALPASVPVLVVGGDLDDLTPLHDARRFAHRLGRRVRVIDLHNTVHVTSEGDTYLDQGAACARLIIDRFVQAPARLASLDARCAARIPALQTPGSYVPTLSAERPATAASGPVAPMRLRRAVTVAAGALADAIVRAQEFDRDHGLGLYGGRWTRRGTHFTLSGIRFVRDARVSGQASYRPATGLTRGRLTVTAEGLHVTVSLAWNGRSRLARATVGATRLTLATP